MPTVNEITILPPRVSSGNTKKIDNQELLGIGEDYFIMRKQEACATKSLVVCSGSRLFSSQEEIDRYAQQDEGESYAGFTGPGNDSIKEQAHAEQHK
jgi:hypothetical protein